jgi:hypothetical protein
MMDPMIKTVVQNGGYIPEQCCPSPTHGYPTALGIAIPADKAGDMAYINAENKKVIADHHMTGHFATWPVPEVMLSIRAMTDLMVDSVEGKADYKNPGDGEAVHGTGSRRPEHDRQVRSGQGQLLPVPCQQHLLLAPTAGATPPLWARPPSSSEASPRSTRAFAL